MHALMPAILLRVTGLDAFNGDAQTQPPDRERSVTHVSGLDPEVSGAPGGTRTPDPLLRRQTLYPAELRAHPWLLF